VPEIRASQSVVRFEGFELDLRSGELRRDGDKTVRLSEQPFRILVLFLEHPREVVTREELRKKLWPNDTIVEFEHSISAAMNRLRQALGDSAEEPHYIETLARRGYRFIGTVTGDGVLGVTQSRQSRQWMRPLSVVAVGVVVALAAGLSYFLSISRHSHPALRIVPFTSSPGRKFAPMFSPDGNEIAYVWRGEKDDNADIYVKLVGAGDPLRLTADPAPDLSPTWSPDGRFIAFLRRMSATGGAYYIVPALGGPERRIAEAYDVPVTCIRCMDWSPDGKYLIVMDKMSPQDPRSNVLLLSAEDGQRRMLSSPPGPYLASPTISPDGKILAFIQGAGFLAQELFVLPISGGAPRPLTMDRRLIEGLTWTRDGKHIVFSSNRGGLMSLWEVSISGGTPEFVSGAGEDAQSPSMSSRGDQLAYVHSLTHLNIWRTGGPGSKRSHNPPEKLIGSSRMDAAGEYSPDGQRIVFSSDRSGNFEVWVSNSDGSNQTQLTALGGSDTGSPRWSPDGNRIAFDSRLEGHSDIFVINAEGGSARRLTSEKIENNVPTWSRDGRWIYFSSDRTGNWQIWKVPSVGGAAVQVTKRGGFIAHESQDGRTLYHWTLDGTIWKMPVEGGQPVRVLSGVPRYFSWVTLGNRIYFLDRDEGSSQINFFDLPSHRMQQVTTVDLGPSTYLLSPAPASKMFSISPDGKSIIYGRVDRLESDIMLIENFP